MEDVFAEIERGFPAAVADLIEMCRFASTRDNLAATLACADWLKARFERAGFESQLLSVPGSNPVVYASLAGTSGKRLLYSNHYDVEIPGDLDAWTSPPFAPDVRADRLYGRGTADNKGSFMTRLLAVEAYLRRRDTLPWGVTFAVEAKTDIFATHFEEIVAAQPELFRADACLWENALNDWDGRPTLRLGDKGMVALEIELAGERRGLGSSFAALTPGAAWDLVWALASVRPGAGGPGRRSTPDDQDEPHTFGGGGTEPRLAGVPEWLRQGIVPLAAEELEMLDALPLEPASQPPLLADSREQSRRLRQEPTFNLSAVIAGRPPAKDGPLSSIPSHAVAYVDLRLLPGQDPDRIVDALTTRFTTALHERDAKARVSTRVLGKLYPHRTRFDHPFVGHLRRAAGRVWNDDARLEPLSTASGSRYGLARHFDMPIVGTGIAYTGSGVLRPDEHVRLEDFRNGIKFMAALLGELAGSA